MSSKEQELDMILSEELGLKDPTFSQLPECKKGLVMQQEIKVIESSFKELMGDIQGFADIHVRDIIIETLKNITHQSFGDKNIFESVLIDKNGRTQFKQKQFKNAICRRDWNEYCNTYNEFISGLVIPLTSPKWSVGNKARLVIAIPPHFPTPQISIQFYVNNVDKWVSVPCRTNTVKETIMNLFPQD